MRADQSSGMVDPVQRAQFPIQSDPITSWLTAFSIKSAVWFKVLFAPSYGSDEYRDRIKRVVADKLCRNIITPQVLHWFNEDTSAYAYMQYRHMKDYRHQQETCEKVVYIAGQLK